MDWITKRAKCTVEKQFEALRPEVEAAVEERNSTLDKDVFRVSNGPTHIFVSKEHPEYRDTWVRFSRPTKQEILIEFPTKDCPDGLRFIAIPCFGEEDNCYFEVKCDNPGSVSKELSLEDLIREFLEELFFS